MFRFKNSFKDAQRFARRSRRKCLTSSDVDFSLKARSIEVILSKYFALNLNLGLNDLKINFRIYLKKSRYIF